MKKVLLLNPPYPPEEHPTPSFGLMSLAAYIMTKGYEVKIEDYIIENCSKDRFKSVIEQYKPDIVGATAVSMTVNKSLSILKDYKSLSPNIITVIGGPHATFDSIGMLNSGAVDFVVRGEGEITFSELLDTLSNGGDISSINGISYKSDGKILHTPDRDLIKDIYILPLPARHLVTLSKYRAMDLPINMVTSRGCPHSCIFCLGRKMVGQRVRYFDVDRVVDEFEMLSKIGFSQINIADDLFTSNKKRCIAICDGIISRCIKQRWSAFARIDTVSEDLLIKLKEAGCVNLCFGIESGDQNILDRVKKRITLSKCQTVSDMCKRSGIIPFASFILGLPGETEETLMKTLRFARDLNMDFGMHILAPFPGTEIRENAEEYGLHIFTDDWDKYDANRSVSSTGGIAHEKIDKIVSDFYDSLNNYMEQLAIKKGAGEKLSENDEAMLRKSEVFNFHMELIKGNFIEDFNAAEVSDRAVFIEELSSYIHNKLGNGTDFISTMLHELVAKGCIEIVKSNNTMTANWI
jgi:radical SAM superfamily enzyme YgiQ (UPF0313 family)